MRKAGKLADLALKAAVDETRAGADEGRILAAQQAAIFAGGGDYPGNEFIIGSGYKPQRLASLYMGCVSYSLRFFRDGTITLSAMKRAEIG